MYFPSHYNGKVLNIWWSDANFVTVILRAATKETGLDVNAHKTKYMTVSRDQNTGRIHSMKMDNIPIERVEEFKYLRTTLTNQILLRKKLRVDWS